MSNSLKNVEALATLGDSPPFANPSIDRPLAAAKNPAEATPDVRRKAGAVDRVTQGKCTKHRYYRLAVVLKAAGKSPFAQIGEDIFACLPRIEPKTFDTDRKSTRLNSSHVSESRMPS